MIPTTMQISGPRKTNLLDSFLGQSAYSFVFDGQIGYLNHALANESLYRQVTGVTNWHINADEIPVFDYNDDFQDSGEASFRRESAALPIYEGNAFRSSDHDPVIIGLTLDVPADTIIIDGCDSQVDNIQFEDGKSMSDLIDQCAADAKNHGKFTRCVSRLTNDWKKNGHISGKEKGKIQKCAAKADLP